MEESNGYVRQREFHQEMKEVRSDINELKVMLAEYHSDVKHGATAQDGLKKALNKLTDWQGQTDDRLDELEGNDKRYIAVVGAIGVIAGALITVVGNLILAAMG